MHFSETAKHWGRPASQYTHFISVPLAYDDKFRQLVDGFREDTLPLLAHTEPILDFCGLMVTVLCVAETSSRTLGSERSDQHGR